MGPPHAQMAFARPWTPPETGHGASPPPEYSPDPFQPHSSHSSDEDNNCWLPSARPDTSSNTSARRDTPSEPLIGQPHPASTISEPTPCTPTKTFTLGGHAHGALRYPYTPESSRILRAGTAGSLSPIPWDHDSDYSASPVQSALSSCIAHFENFILTRQPTEDQMEYIVGQFEAMTTYLSAPDPQTKSTAEHLASDLADIALAMPTTQQSSSVSQFNAEYITQVGAYIEGVAKHTTDLKARLEEVKALNRTQQAMINDLQTKVNSAHSEMRDVAEVNELPPAKELVLQVQHTPVMADSSTQTTLTETVRVQSTPVKRGFWASFNDALDAFGDDLLDG